MKLKNIYSLIFLSSFGASTLAQVGINTANPQSTLDVTGNGASATIKDGIMAPRISKQQLAAKNAGTYGAAQAGAIVYVTDITAPSGTVPSVAQTLNVNAAGYYFFDGLIWRNVSDGAVNIYNSDGSLNGNRIVTQAANNLTFTSTTGTFGVNTNNNGFQRSAFTNTNTGASSRMDLNVGAGTANIYLGVDNGSAVFGAGTKAYLDNRTGGRLGIGTSGTEQVSVLTSGNVGIGVTAPTNKLHINATDPLRLQGLTAGVTTTDPLVVVDATGVLKTIGTLSSLSIPNPAVFRLETTQTNFLNGQGSGGSQVVPMTVIKNTIPGMTYNAGTSTVTFPAGTYQITFVYEANHNNTGCTISSYFVDFPLNAATSRIHNTASHVEGGLASHGGAITYATTVPANKTWTISLGRGQSGNCSGPGMTLLSGSTQVLIFRIGD